MPARPLTDPVDYILLAGQRSPGIARVPAIPSPRKWDVRRGWGMGGATAWYVYKDLAKFTIAFELYTDQDWDDWHAWKPEAMKIPSPSFRGFFSPRRPPKALDIWHPLIEDAKIKSVVVTNVHQPAPGGSGMWIAKIDFLEYKRPRGPSLSKPEGAKEKKLDPVQQRIAANNERIKQLREQLAE